MYIDKRNFIHKKRGISDITCWMIPQKFGFHLTMLDDFSYIKNTYNSTINKIMIRRRNIYLF